MKFFGDYYVGLDQVSVDNIRIFGGDLFVAGRVEGQIIVLGGDVTLESTSIVNGQIVAIGGTINEKDGSIVNGKVVEANIKEGISYSEGPSSDVIPQYHDFRQEERYISPIHWWTNPNIHWFIYNRNEGFLCTPFNWHWDRRSLSSLRLSLSLGYRFGLEESSRRFAGKLSLEKGFFKQRNLIVFASIFRESQTDDSHRMPLNENSLATLLARQDFYDRWDEEGSAFGAGFGLNSLRFKVSYRNVEIDSIPITHRQFKMFQRDRLFRPNLPVISGSVRSVSTTITARTPGLEALESGLGILITGEKILSADAFDPFTRVMGMLTANIKPTPDIVLRTRTLVGTTLDTLPEFRYFGVGGLGSVSAFPYKVQRGDRMLQTNVELVFLPEFLDDDILIALFADGGYAWKDEEHGFSDYDTILDNALTAIGIGFGDEDMDWRINIARPLDGRDVWETTFRLNFNF